MEGDGVDWMDLTQETEKWLVGGGVLVNAVMKIRVQKKIQRIS